LRGADRAPRRQGSRRHSCYAATTDYANADPCNALDLDGRAAGPAIVIGGVVIAAGDATFKCAKAGNAFWKYANSKRKWLEQHEARIAAQERLPVSWQWVVNHILLPSGYWHEALYWCPKFVEDVLKKGIKGR
jgi:hypothetical protein